MIRLILIIVFIPSLLFAGHLHPERYYQEIWCQGQGGKMETVMPDRTRCDCETDTHANEFKFAKEWMDAIGQSLNYGFQTGKKAGIVLIIEDESQKKYWIQLNSLIQYYSLPIDAWEVNPGKQ